jgi:hypothetical protein
MLFNKPKLLETPVSSEYAAEDYAAEDYAPVRIEPDGTSRDAVLAAAREYDQQQRRIAELEDLLRRAGAEVAAAAHQLDELKLNLATERNHVQSYKAERDDAIQDRANVVAILANIGAIIEHGINAGDIPPKKRKNGKTSVDGPLPDPAAPAAVPSANG